MRYQKRVSTCFPLSIYEFQFLSLRLKEEKGKQMNACQLQIRRDSIYKILKKKKKKGNSKETFIKRIVRFRHFSQNFEAGRRLVWQFLLLPPRVSRVRLLALLVPAKCQSQETCQRRQMCRVSAASYRACTSPLRSGVSAVKSGRIPRKAQNFQPPGSPN